MLDPPLSRLDFASQHYSQPLLGSLILPYDYYNRQYLYYALCIIIFSSLSQYLK